MKRHSKRDSLKDVFVVVVSTLIGLFLSTLIIAAVIVSQADSNTTEGQELNYLKCIPLAWKEAWPPLQIAVGCLFALVGLAWRHNLKHYEYNQELSNKIDSKKLVLHPGMEEYDCEHLRVLEGILFPIQFIDGKKTASQSSPRNKLLVVDATDPNGWWTNDMLGYLALQSRWASESPHREVKRIFVWGKEWLMSTPGIKLIILHNILGCKTIICPPSEFYKAEKRNDYKREFVVWDDDTALGASSRIGDGIYGYESYHYIYQRDLDRLKCIKEEASRLNVSEESFIKFNPVDKNRAINFRGIFNSIESISDTDEKKSKVLFLDSLEVAESDRKIREFASRLKW